MYETLTQSWEINMWLLFLPHFMMQTFVILANIQFRNFLFKLNQLATHNKGNVIKCTLNVFSSCHVLHILVAYLQPKLF